MESVIGELFEMGGVSRGEGQARAVRFPSNVHIWIYPDVDVGHVFEIL